MLHYKYVSNKLKNSTVDMYFRVFEDEDIFEDEFEDWEFEDDFFEEEEDN